MLTSGGYCFVGDAHITREVTLPDLDDDVQGELYLGLALIWRIAHRVS